MKRYTFTSLLIASILLGAWLPSGVKTAEESNETTSSKSKLKLLYELTLPECITAFSVKKGEDGKNDIDKIMTIAGIYELHENRQTRQIVKRTKELPVKTRCYPSSEAFSPDGRYVVFDNNPGEYPGNFLIHDFEKKTSSPIDVALFGAFSNRSIMFFARQVPSLVTDFSGNKIAELPEMVTIKGFENGFVCYGYGMDSILVFLNSEGQILDKKSHHSHGLAYDVAYKNGITAIIVPSESSLTVYDSSGGVKHVFNVPFHGHYAGIGISANSKYIAVMCSEGWIKFFDIPNKKELWKKDFTWGGRFIGSRSIPIAHDANYIIVYGDLEKRENPVWSMIILDHLGNTVALFDAPRDRGYMAYYHIDFIPETHRIVGFTDNTLSVYEIIEGE